ncbi:hypothetical protein K2173_003127 [Erythroxylum novogranatense]|uniref:NAD-dependent epimerase/dehydratase domain-containing protein n=1 Tax=Erythroxylum novogranatense TaxID=1862640 RepID=A0AAV8TBK3_9ROSI|nr:hypothetical protein K2173_003127 [Erythroxylum novogranatense]
MEGWSQSKSCSSEKNEEHERSVDDTYCVTGANGYIGSWLVKLLLQKGHTVHATVRDPEKVMHLLPLWTGGVRLRLFKADLQEEGSFDEAVKGCHGVFHVAASMEFSVPEIEDIDKYVRSSVIDPAIKGTLNLLNSCRKCNTVRRIVFTSSISTLSATDGARNCRAVVDETCQVHVDRICKMKAAGWVYVLSKLLTEEAAFNYAKENDIDLVSVITTTVAGPFLTSSVPSSIQVLLSPLTGDSNFFSILSAVNARMGSIALVHIEDICNAHLFLMQQARAEGRYICCSQSCVMSELVDILGKAYPNSSIRRIAGENQVSPPSEISSKKLKHLGFHYKHSIKDIIQETISCCVGYGFLPH